MILDVLPVGCTWVLDVNQFQTALYVAKIFWGMCPRPVISDSLSALKLMCSYLKALAAVRDWNPSHCSAVVCSPSFKVRHTQNQPSNKFICLFPKPKCPKRQRFIYRDLFGKHLLLLLIPGLVGCWISIGFPILVQVDASFEALNRTTTGTGDFFRSLKVEAE